MGIIIRQSLKAGIGFYLGVLIGIINQMYVSTRFLSVEELALSRLLFENALLFAAFAHLGTPFIADKFFAFFRKDEEKHNGILPFLLLLPFVGGLVFAILYFVFTPQIKNYFGEQSPKVLQYHYLVVPITLFWSYINVLEAYCRNNARIAVPNFIREVYLRLTNMLLVLMLGVGWINFDWMIYLMVASYGLAVVLLVVYIHHLGKWYWRAPVRSVLSPALLGQMLRFGGFTLLGGIGANLMLFIDRTMLAGEHGLHSTGIFIIAAYIAGIIEIPRKAISQISIPLLSEALTRNDIPQVKTLAQKSAINQLLVGGLFFLVIWTNIDAIFTLIPKGDIYREGKYVVLFLALVKVFDIGTGLNNEIILYSRYFRWTTLFIVTGAVISFGLNFWLIPLYGFTGAAFATAATTLLYSLIRLGFVWKKFQVLSLSAKTLQTALLLAGIYLVVAFIPVPTGTLLATLLAIAGKSLLALLLFTFFTLFFRLSEDLNLLYEKALEMLRLRWRK